MKTYVYILFATLFLSGCKTIHFQQAEILSRQNNISQLKDRVDQAQANDVDVLAPAGFQKAKALLDQAINEAQTTDSPDAGNKTAEDGLKAIAVAEETAANARETLADVLGARKNGLAAHAHILYEHEWNELEHQLTDAARATEGGNKKIGLEKNATLSSRYAELEVRAMKSNISEVAEKAYEQAKDAGAKKLAPITLKSAKSELEIARRIIDVEKENYTKAQFHAERARYLAMRAKYIAELATGFKKEKLTDEELILWYQTQLETLHRSLGFDIRFDKTDKEVIEKFASDIKQNVADLRDLETKTVLKEERFRSTSEIFSKDEAEVVRRGDDIIIRCYGFHFPVGKSELLSRNYDLLHKIVKAINKFPKSNIVVEGHTDSTGSKKINMTLSEQRASNIADFLVKVAKLDQYRISSIGVGDDNPIATNQTEEGRSLNRRIDIIVKGTR